MPGLTNILGVYRLQDFLRCSKCCTAVVCRTEAVRADSMQGCLRLLVGKGTARVGQQRIGEACTSAELLACACRQRPSSRQL